VEKVGIGSSKIIGHSIAQEGQEPNCKEAQTGTKEHIKRVALRVVEAVEGGTEDTL
jgi:hypothetical protein